MTLLHHRKFLKFVKMVDEIRSVSFGKNSTVEEGRVAYDLLGDCVPVRYIRKIRSIRKIARLDGKVRKSNGVLQTSPPLLLLLPPPFGVG